MISVSLCLFFTCFHFLFPIPVFRMDVLVLVVLRFQQPLDTWCLFLTFSMRCVTIYLVFKFQRVYGDKEWIRLLPIQFSLLISSIVVQYRTGEGHGESDQSVS